MYQLSSHGLALTKKFEGLRLTAYQDCVGVWTIGYGHTGSDVHPGLTITPQQAEHLLLADVTESVKTINEWVDVPLTQNQFDALCDFVFNVGIGAFLHSTLLTDINKGDLAAAAGQFKLWCHAGGKVVSGLLKRREAEAALFQEAA